MHLSEWTKRFSARVSVTTKLVLLLIVILPAGLFGQSSDVPGRILFHSDSLPETTQLSGFVISSSLNPFSQASVERFWTRAEEDFRSSILTSVLVASFGNLDYSMRSFREFAIHDNPIDSLVVLDSLAVASYTVMRVGLPADQARPAPCTSTTAEIHNVPTLAEGCWYVRGQVASSGVDPHHSYIQARQAALKQLSLFMGTRVQSLDESVNNLQINTNYQFSSFLFFDIALVELVITETHTHVMLGIPDATVVSLN